jgi:hypothetical protein
MEYTKGDWNFDSKMGQVLSWNKGEATPIATILDSSNDLTFNNALLIGAAPRMYEALRNLLEVIYLKYPETFPNSLKIAEAALAKAEGRE